MSPDPQDVYAAHREGVVTVAVAGGVARVVLNDPARRNALTERAKQALVAIVEAVALDPAVRAVVLCGEGPAFCVGQDLTEHAAALERGAEAAFATVGDHYSRVVAALVSMPKPVVAAVQGACVGAGLGLALACDLRVWGERAKVGTAFTGIGLTFDTGLSVTLPRAVGDARARELMLSGRVLGALEAVEWGMGGEVVPDDEVGTRASELAVRLAAGPTVAYAETKRLLGASSRAWADALAEEQAAQTRCGATSDHRDAVAAFLAKRAPEFSGR